MKFITYEIVSGEINHGTDENPDMEQILLEKSMPWTEANETIAAKEAHNGLYTIEDDGTEETAAPTTAERLDALEAAMLEMALGGV